MSRQLVHGGIFIAGLFLLCGAVSAQQTLYVDDATCPNVGDGSSINPYCKIQDAICFLKNNVPEGGTVLVRPGTYFEAIRSFAGISIVSTDGPAVTVIDATGKPCITKDCLVNTATTSCSAVMITGSGTSGGPTIADRFEGFRVTGGRGYLWTSEPFAIAGGGLFIWGNASPTITRNEIVGNTSSGTGTETFYGAGVYTNSNILGGFAPAQPVITQNLIEGNIVDPPAGTSPARISYAIGGGFYIGGDAAPQIVANTIRGNRSGDRTKDFLISTGGGVSMYGRALAGTTIISRNLFQSNYVASYGAGIFGGPYMDNVEVMYPGVGVVESNVFQANDANFGAGLATTSSAVVFQANTFALNVAGYGGGGYFDPPEPDCPAADPTLVNNLLTFNTATVAAGGGAMYVDGIDANPVVRYNDLHGNVPENVAGTKTDADYIGVDGNVSVDPLFVNQAAGDFHLQATSPVVDAGDNAFAPPLDLDGAPRPADGDGDGNAVVDMGAFEFSQDFDGDGIPDSLDEDDDNDTVPDAADCAPFVRGVSSIPGPIGNTVRLDKTSGGRLRWGRGVQGHTTNVYRGTRLPGGPWSYNEICLDGEIPGVELLDGAIPSSGTLYYYQVSARNICGESAVGESPLGGDRFPPAFCPAENLDTDGDGVQDKADNCAGASYPNANQLDGDVDWVGDVCDICPAAPDPPQMDSDADGHGDACDNCPAIANATQTDSDADGHGDACDNCVAISNPSQSDADTDLLGDACDPCTDLDGDGFGNPGYSANTCPTDNCPAIANPTQADSDSDTVGDACDNCVAAANPDQANLDGDAFGDVCDLDLDGDATANLEDCAPYDPTAWDVPGEVQGLSVSDLPPTRLAWLPESGGGVVYDLIGDSLGALRAGGGVSGASCLVSGLAVLTWDDSNPTPLPGEGRYYLVRARNSCGNGGYGVSTAGPRVPLVPCP